MPQYTTFSIGGSLFGLDVVLVREINQNTDVTPVSMAPAYVRGLLNLRGQIVTVLDLGVRLGIGAREQLDTSKIVILKTDDELAARGADAAAVEGAPHDIVGLWVDDIGDMIHTDQTSIEPPPANVGGVDARYLQGVIKLEGQLLIVLKPGQVAAIDS